MDSKADVLKLTSRLRKAGYDPELIATALTQVKLRRKARTKFGEFAEQLLFTEAGLEQASRLSVAAIHAGRFRNAGIKNVADLGCGIGAESLALASLDLTVTAFELDELTAAIATFNLANFPNVSVLQADVTQLDLSIYEGLIFDPARRDNRNRIFKPEDFSPSFDFVLVKAKSKPTIVKLGPGHPHNQIPEEAEAVWVSVNGDLVELALYFGDIKRASIKRAALLITGSARYEITSATADVVHAPIGSIGKYLYEPDNSLIRSHLLGQLAEELSLQAISPEIAYLTSDQLVSSPWLTAFEIIDELPFDRKKLKSYLKEKDVGILEIKKRGADVIPEELRKELNLKGKNSATLVITRVLDQHRVLVVEPHR
ncbi:MAG: THUMP-like domain-containing protein [Rhodoluna sp.]